MKEKIDWEKVDEFKLIWEAYSNLLDCHRHYSKGKRKDKIKKIMMELVEMMNEIRGEIKCEE